MTIGVLDEAGGKQRALDHLMNSWRVHSRRDHGSTIGRGTLTVLHPRRSDVSRWMRSDDAFLFISGDPQALEISIRDDLKGEAWPKRWHVLLTVIRSDTEAVFAELHTRLMQFFLAVEPLATGEDIPWNLLYPPTLDEALIGALVWCLAGKDGSRQRLRLPTEANDLWRGARENLADVRRAHNLPEIPMDTWNLASMHDPAACTSLAEAILSAIS